MGNIINELFASVLTEERAWMKVDIMGKGDMKEEKAFSLLNELD